MPIKTPESATRRMTLEAFVAVIGVIAAIAGVVVACWGVQVSKQIAANTDATAMRIEQEAEKTRSQDKTEEKARIQQAQQLELKSHQISTLVTIAPLIYSQDPTKVNYALNLLQIEGIQDDFCKPLIDLIGSTVPQDCFLAHQTPPTSLAPLSSRPNVTAATALFDGQHKFIVQTCVAQFTDWQNKHACQAAQWRSAAVQSAAPENAPAVAAAFKVGDQITHTSPAVNKYNVFIASDRSIDQTEMDLRKYQDRVGTTNYKLRCFPPYSGNQYGIAIVLSMPLSDALTASRFARAKGFVPFVASDGGADNTRLSDRCPR